MAKFRTHYDNLKVHRNAPDSVIRAAYKALMQQYHPDKFAGDADKAHRIAKIINQSFEVLIDPVKRAEHDRWLDEQEAEVNDKAQFNATDEGVERQYYQQEEYKPPAIYKEPPIKPSAQKSGPFKASEETKQSEEQPIYIWRRIFARSIDYFISSLILMWLIYASKDSGVTQQLLKLIHSPENTQFTQEVIYSVLAAFIWIPVEGTLLKYYGKTPGKILLKLSISCDESEPRFYSRSFYFWLVGIGCSLPIICLLVAINALRDLKNNRLSYWDRWTKCHIEAEPISAGRVSFAGLLVFSFFIGSALLNPQNKGLIFNKENQHQSAIVYGLSENTRISESKESFQSEYKKAKYLYINQHYVEAAEAMQKLAAQGHSSAQNELGLYYTVGMGVPQDYKQAFYWFSKSAEQGDTAGQFNLATAYSYGDGVPQDYVQAYKWLNIAAARGDENSRIERDSIAKQMSDKQLQLGQELSSAWIARH